MYCPNCATPIDGMKYCRACGANVSLIPQALTGQLQQLTEEDGGRGRRGRRAKKAPNIEKAATNFFTGIGFILASILVLLFFPGGFTWGWALLIPAFVMIGEGVGQYLRLKQEREQQLLNRQVNQFNRPANYQPPIPPAQSPALSAPTTSELAPPSSVAEHTTKHLESSRPGG